MLYEKALRLPLSGVAFASPGKLITLASGDMALIEEGSLNLHCLVGIPLAAILLIVSLYQIVSK